MRGGKPGSRLLGEEKSLWLGWSGRISGEETLLIGLGKQKRREAFWAGKCRGMLPAEAWKQGDFPGFLGEEFEQVGWVS